MQCKYICNVYLIAQSKHHARQCPHTFSLHCNHRSIMRPPKTLQGKFPNSRCYAPLKAYITILVFGIRLFVITHF